MVQMRKNHYVGYYDASMDDETLDNELATPTSDGLMSKEDKIKLDSMSEGGSSGPVKADNIVETSDKKFVSEEQIKKWDSSSHEVTYDPNKEAIVLK